MKKVEVFKDSKGNLFEKEKDYILSEAEIQRKLILDNWDRIGDAIRNKPELYYLFIKQIGDKIIDGKLTKGDIQEDFDKTNNLFEKEKDIKFKGYASVGEQVEYEPYIWGNDILDGYDVNH